MIRVLSDDFFEKETLEKVQYHVTHKLMRLRQDILVELNEKFKRKLLWRQI